jgi:squalene-associated FAD-dependent desaturase
MAETVHVIGAGLAGLSAAVRLAGAGRAVVVHEAARFAGGRCRSYRDPGLGLTIDNGNHLLLSGNWAARDYLTRVGAGAGLPVPAEAAFPFVDLATDERWTLRPNNGRLPHWILDRRRRVPGSRPRDYLAPLRLLRADPAAEVGTVMDCAGPLYERLWRPLLLAGLNTDPPEAAAGLAARLLRETLAAGGRACRPLVAATGLSATFILPALASLHAGGAQIRFSTLLRGLDIAGDRVRALDFDSEQVALGPGDAVVLAVPANIAADLMPDLTTPDEFRAIVNLHFRVAPPPGLPPMTGIVGGLAEWLFAFQSRLSVTISGADRLIDMQRDVLAAEVWREVAAITALPDELPPWQIVKERRATFAATPRQAARRPGARTTLENLVLAGDWTDTGLPATIEGAVRSGYAAAAALETAALRSRAA